MEIKHFLESSGLRAVSMVGLKSTSSYQLFLYLLDGMILGKPQVIADAKELSLLVGLSEEQTSEAFDELLYHHMIRPVDISKKSELIALELDLSKWRNSVANRKPQLMDPDTAIKEANAHGNGTENLTDLNAFREKQEIYDSKVRALAVDVFKNLKSADKTINADEELLLHILMHHHHPRKQLHWALKVKTLYPNLESFLNQASVAAELADST